MNGFIVRLRAFCAAVSALTSPIHSPTLDDRPNPARHPARLMS